MLRHGIVAEHVWKKFRRGELHDSLRDLVPAMAKRLLRKRRRRDQLGERDFWALKDVSFELGPGDAVGIIGPNGAGKSTLLKILSNILQPNRGVVRVRGRLRALIEVAAGFHGDLTGYENIFLTGSILGMNRREIARKLGQIVEFSGIEPFLETPVKRYSSGMLARLGFSVAAHMDPEVLLVDEILAVGDLAFQKKCYRYMQGLTAQGVALILVSHNLSAIAQLCPRTLVLSRGVLHFNGKTEEAQRSYFALLKPSEAAEGGFTLEEIHLLNDSGIFTTVIEPGGACHVKVILRAKNEHRNLSLGLSLLSATGSEIFHTNTARLTDETMHVKENEQVELTGDLVLNLCGGNYTLQVHGYDYAGPAREVFRLDAAEIQVPRSPQYGGVCFLGPRLKQRLVGHTSGIETGTA